MSIVNKLSVSATAQLFGGQEGTDFHLECFCQNDQLGICDAAKLRLNFGEGAPAQIPPQDRAAGGKHLLRHPLLVAKLSDLWPDDVLQFDHAPKTELDFRRAGELNCSNIGATSRESEVSGIPKFRKMQTQYLTRARLLLNRPTTGLTLELIL